MNSDAKNLAAAPAQIDREKLAPPGIDGFLHIVEFGGKNDPRGSAEVRFGDTSRRLFRLKAALGKKFSLTEHIDGGLVDGVGESYLVSPHPGPAQVATSLGTLLLHTNAQGEVATISADCESISYQEAFQHFLAAVTPLLARIIHEAPRNGHD